MSELDRIQQEAVAYGPEHVRAWATARAAAWRRVNECREDLITVTDKAMLANLTALRSDPRETEQIKLYRAQAKARLASGVVAARTSLQDAVDAFEIIAALPAWDWQPE